MSGVKLGTLLASGKPVELTRYTGPFNLVMLQFTAATGYIQVGAAELLQVLVKAHPAIEQKTLDESIAAGGGICEPCREGFCVHSVCKPRGCGCTKAEAGG